MSNLAPDWGAYYSTCSECGERCHTSGTVECGCAECIVCGEWYARDDMNDDGDGHRCNDCVKEEA